MIIQHLDGTAESCPLPSALARWAHDLLRRVQSLRVVVEVSPGKPMVIASSPCHCGDGGKC